MSMHDPAYWVSGRSRQPYRGAMTRLSTDAYLEHIRLESSRFRDVLASIDPATPVPSCPEWTAADLLWHLSGVQAFWSHVVTHRPQAPQDYLQPVRPATHPERSDERRVRGRVGQDV